MSEREMDSLGVILRAERARAGLSLEQLARAAGIPGGRSTVHRWEVGDRCPPPWAVGRLMEAMGASPETGELARAALEERGRAGWARMSDAARRGAATKAARVQAIIDRRLTEEQRAAVHAARAAAKDAARGADGGEG